MLIYDEEFADVLEPAREAGGRRSPAYVAWREARTPIRPTSRSRT